MSIGRVFANALHRWIAVIAGLTILFLVLGNTVEDWFGLWFMLFGGILIVLLGVEAVLRWRRRTGG